MTVDAARSPVVVGIGAGGPGGDALDWGAAEAAARGSPLRLVHAVPTRLVVDPWGLAPPGDGPRSAGPLVEAALRRARTVAPDVEVSGHVLLGGPAAVLAQQSRAAALLVLGDGREAGSGGGWPAGVLRARLATRSACPVVVVRTRPPVPEAPTAPRVVVGVDAGRSCVAALGFALGAAAQRGVPLVVVHAWAEDAPADLEGVCAAPAVVEAEARKTLDAVLDRWCPRSPAVPVHRRTVHGTPAAALLAASRGAALVVVGCRGHGPLRTWLSGSVSRAVARSASCPVAVVGADCTVPPGSSTARLPGRRATPGG
ncbi:universal stress protein [Geodermatophilus sabuli]|uniref:Nucleotide-binding universal stress protein, UspA family n=1 Tax=Geodermatophilus sabuli TaxID=1564158 RepID=A0A285E6D5_9ACTN|nr:universal stress protein [Geodermatophilus sabuli]MBB3082451.1 nucleotide-binding universal stress UspA family protein [Geodermatophilus sabuli]SNX94679.1 Nucleotide-binding universal stress protein, UspA family [Geodermatophilus sabuli]